MKKINYGLAFLFVLIFSLGIFNGCTEDDEMHSNTVSSDLITKSPEQRFTYNSLKPMFLSDNYINNKRFSIIRTRSGNYEVDGDSAAVDSFDVVNSDSDDVIVREYQASIKAYHVSEFNVNLDLRFDFSATQFVGGTTFSGYVTITQPIGTNAVYSFRGGVDYLDEDNMTFSVTGKFVKSIFGIEIEANDDCTIVGYMSSK